MRCIHHCVENYCIVFGCCLEIFFYRYRSLSEYGTENSAPTAQPQRKPVGQVLRPGVVYVLCSSGWLCPHLSWLFKQLYCLAASAATAATGDDAVSTCHRCLSMSVPRDRGQPPSLSSSAADRRITHAVTTVSARLGVGRRIYCDTLSLLSLFAAVYGPGDGRLQRLAAEMD